MNSKPSRDEAIAFALERFKGQCPDYPGGTTGLIADIACISYQGVKNIGRFNRKRKKLPGGQELLPEKT